MNKPYSGFSRCAYVGTNKAGNVLEATDEVLDHPAQTGYDPQFGVRPQSLNELSKAILAGDLFSRK